MVYKWMDRFDEEGPSGLYEREREGRPPKIDEEAEEELRRVLEAGPPTKEGYEATRWTVPRLTEHLEKRLGIDVHPETVRDALKRLEYSWKRPRRSLPPDPDFAERIRRIDRAVASAGPETTILFEDETELRRFPPLRRAWMRLGEQRSVEVPSVEVPSVEVPSVEVPSVEVPSVEVPSVEVPSVEVPEANGKFVLYGALDVLTGKVLAETHPKGRSDYTKDFLASLLSEVEGKILLVWDNASWHTSKAVGKLIKKHERLEVIALPARSPQANPIEDLWRRLKNTVAANLERSLDALRAACREFFERLTPEQALRTAGLAPDG